MNYMKKVAQMLGVELEKEFKLNDDYHKYKLNDKGLVMYECGEWTVQSLTFTKLLNGQCEIIKLPKPILDDEEKKYLSNVIKPFRKDIVFIQKTDRCVKDDLEYLTFQIHDLLDDSYYMMNLPCFKKSTMYKGMKAGKDYTLEELGL